MLRKLLILVLLLNNMQLIAQTHVAKAVPPFQNVNTAEDPQAIGALLPAFKVVTNPRKELVTDKNLKMDGAVEKASFKTVPGRAYTNSDLAYNGNLFLMFFNPSCGHCEDMTVMLEHNVKLFKKTKVLMVAAPQAQPYLDMFTNGFKTNDYPTLIVGVDSLDLIGKLFLYKSLPQFNIYDKDRKLLKVFSGDTPIDSLKPYIQ